MKVDKVRKKFVLYAELSVFILLTVLLSVINVINFTMVAEDADHVTEAISFSTGKFVKEEPSPENLENPDGTESTESKKNETGSTWTGRSNDHGTGRTGNGRRTV